MQEVTGRSTLLSLRAGTSVPKGSAELLWWADHKYETASYTPMHLQGYQQPQNSNSWGVCCSIYSVVLVCINQPWLYACGWSAARCTRLTSLTTSSRYLSLQKCRLHKSSAHHRYVSEQRGTTTRACYMQPAVVTSQKKRNFVARDVHNLYPALKLFECLLASALAASTRWSSRQTSLYLSGNSRLFCPVASYICRRQASVLGTSGPHCSAIQSLYAHCLSPSMCVYLHQLDQAMTLTSRLTTDGFAATVFASHRPSSAQAGKRDL